VWFSARRNQQGLVYAWKAGSTDAPFVAFEFPAGQFPQALGFYLGNVFVRCIEPLAAGGAKATIYQAATSSGRLIPQVVTTIESTTDDHTVGAFGGDDRFAMFSWKKQTIGGRSGVGAIDLSTGGHARWLYAPADTATGDVVSVVNWNGRTVFAVAGYGVCHETTGPVPSGFLRTDIADLGSSVAKVLSQLKADTAPLPTGAGLSIAFTVDGGASYSPNTFAMSGAGLQTLTGDISKQAVTVGLKITLTATTVTPVLRSVTLRVHPIGLADQVIVLPVNCSDDPIGLNGQPLPEGGKGSGAARARFLESLAQTRIRYQDIDWAFNWRVVHLGGRAGRGPLDLGVRSATEPPITRPGSGAVAAKELQVNVPDRETNPQSDPVLLRSGVPCEVRLLHTGALEPVHHVPYRLLHLRASGRETLEGSR
jgi:hypothetical protein